MNQSGSSGNLHVHICQKYIQIQHGYELLYLVCFWKRYIQICTQICTRYGRVHIGYNTCMTYKRCYICLYELVCVCTCGQIWPWSGCSSPKTSKAFCCSFEFIMSASLSPRWASRLPAWRLSESLLWGRVQCECAYIHIQAHTHTNTVGYI